MKRSGLAVDADSRLQADFKLEVVGQAETVTVSASVDEVRVERVVDAARRGRVGREDDRRCRSNGRSYTDLLAIQPGITPVTTMKPNSIIMAGVTGAIEPSGELNPGNVSINGQREIGQRLLRQRRQRAGAHERRHARSCPNLDSIAEFRVLTNNFDAEYGNYNGGIVNVVTKSGSDRFHGNGFEFLRNTALDSQGYFSDTKASFNQNQFGGTLGGPLQRRQAVLLQRLPGHAHAPGHRDRPDFGAVEARTAAATSPISPSTLTGSVNGSYWANLLSQRLGYAVTPGERYYFAGCTSSAQCVLPNAAIPQRAWSVPAQHLLQYIPAPNAGDAQFSTSAQRPGRPRRQVVDCASTPTPASGCCPAITSSTISRLDNPYPVQQGGASVPGFNALTLGRSQLVSVGDTKVWSQNLVNEIMQLPAQRRCRSAIRRAASA